MEDWEVVEAATAGSVRQAALEVRESLVEGAGLGVFAGEDFPQGTVLEVARVATVAASAVGSGGGDHDFSKYLVRWDDPARPAVVAGIPLGVTSLVNHSPTPNVERVSVFDLDLSVLFSLRALRCGEELLMDYWPD